MTRKIEDYIIQIGPRKMPLTDKIGRELAVLLLYLGGKKFSPQNVKMRWIWTGPLVDKSLPRFQRRSVYPYLYHTYRYPQIPLKMLETRAVFRSESHPLDVNPWNYLIKPRNPDVTKDLKTETVSQDIKDLADLLAGYDDPEMLAMLEETYSKEELEKAKLINKLAGL